MLAFELGRSVPRLNGWLIGGSYLFELVDEVCRVELHFFVCGMQALFDDLVDNPEVASKGVGSLAGRHWDWDGGMHSHQ